MGQIVQKASNPVRCNLAAIQTGGSQANVVLDDGEVWFVDTTNAEKGTDGYGHYDAYIVGDGTKKASALVVKQIDADVDITDVLGENYYADEEGLYIQRSDGNVYPISHPDLSTQPSILPQRFGVFPLKEVLVPNLTNGATFIVDAEIVPLGVTIIDVSVFNANECVSGHTKKENGSIVITNEQGIVPDFALIRYYGEGGNYYYDSSYSGGGSDDEQEEQGIEITPARYLTFTAQQSSSSIGLAQQATYHKVYYSKDLTLWKELDTSTSIALQNNETVYIIGDSAGSMFSTSNYTQFAMNGRIAASGDITSILDYETLDEKNAKYCYYQMFRDCTSLTQAPELPATTLAEYCYRYMFYGCTSLTSAPELPATTLAANCYNGMFRGCTSLTQAPELPATTLAESCYSSMFYDCTSLTQAPELPTTTLAYSCYYSMFRGCTSLTQAPELPATTLTGSCYYSMFYDCTSLTQAPALPATTLANSCYGTMFEGCTSLTQAPALPATTLADGCYSFMFFNCTSLTQAPELPATTLPHSCYRGMFRGCLGVNAITCLATNILSTYSLMQWMDGVASTGTFTKAASMTSWPSGGSGIPNGWTVVDYVEQ